MKIDADELTHFVTRGFIHKQFCRPEKLENFALYPFPDCNKPDAELACHPDSIILLNEIKTEVVANYISPLFSHYTLRSSGMWSGVDKGSMRWHNDFEDGDSFNSNILVYLDDNNPDNGNSIEVRGPLGHYVLYPKCGEMVWLNQAKCFQHKATHSSGTRRLLSFEFYIQDLLK